MIDSKGRLSTFKILKLPCLGYFEMIDCRSITGYGETLGYVKVIKKKICRVFTNVTSGNNRVNVKLRNIQ